LSGVSGMGCGHRLRGCGDAGGGKARRCHDEGRGHRYASAASHPRRLSVGAVLTWCSLRRSGSPCPSRCPWIGRLRQGHAAGMTTTSWRAGRHSVVLLADGRRMACCRELHLTVIESSPRRATTSVDEAHPLVAGQLVLASRAPTTCMTRHTPMAHFPSAGRPVGDPRWSIAHRGPGPAAGPRPPRSPRHVGIAAVSGTVRGLRPRGGAVGTAALTAGRPTTSADLECCAGRASDPACGHDPGDHRGQRGGRHRCLGGR